MRIEHVLANKGDFVATLPPTATVAELVDALGRHGIGAMVISPDGRAIHGIASERDVVRALRRHGAALFDLLVTEIMTPEVQCAPVAASTEDLMVVMTEQHFRHIPIIDDEGSMLGIVSIGDIVKSRIGELEGERAALIEYVTAGR